MPFPLAVSTALERESSIDIVPFLIHFLPLKKRHFLHVPQHLESGMRCGLVSVEYVRVREFCSVDGKTFTDSQIWYSDT